MSRDELRSGGERLLGQARALRAAFPDVAAMRVVAGGEVVAESAVGNEGAALWSAMGYLCAEMTVVRDGRADSLTVLDDEIAHVERLMTQPEQAARNRPGTSGAV